MFLAEAFTRPAMMHGLGKVGFTQSYTYFTWRTTAGRCASTARSWSRRPTTCGRTSCRTRRTSCTSTLQHGGPAMFTIRAVLAAHAVPAWGIYSGYELYEHVARPGAEEYLDNEKYQLRPRDWAASEAAGRVAGPFLARLNDIRRAQPGPALAA